MICFDYVFQFDIIGNLTSNIQISNEVSQVFCYEENNLFSCKVFHQAENITEEGNLLVDIPSSILLHLNQINGNKTIVPSSTAEETCETLTKTGFGCQWLCTDGTDEMKCEPTFISSNSTLNIGQFIDIIMDNTEIPISSCEYQDDTVDYEPSQESLVLPLIGLFSAAIVSMILFSFILKTIKNFRSPKIQNKQEKDNESFHIILSESLAVYLKLFKIVVERESGYVNFWTTSFVFCLVSTCNLIHLSNYRPVLSLGYYRFVNDIFIF